MKIKQKQIRSFFYLAVFLFAAIATTFQILQVSSEKTLQLVLRNPDLGSYSYLVKNGYLFER